MKKKIDDFGEMIPGAHKHQHRDWVDSADPNGSTVSQIFPEPPWQSLLDDGYSSVKISAVRAMRDHLTSSPVKQGLANRVRILSEQIIYGEGHNTLREINDAYANLPGSQYSVDRVMSRAFLYHNIGHDASLRSYYSWRTRTGNVNVMKGKRSIGASADIHGTVRIVQNELGRDARKRQERADAPRRIQFRIYQNNEDGSYFIGVKRGSNIVRIATSRNANELRRRIGEGDPDLTETYERLINIPDPHAKRDLGQSIRSGELDKDITPDDFSEHFNFRGVQFGESLPEKDKQNVLNETFIAFKDMQDLLSEGVMSDMSQAGDLALSFGARGRGRAMAHYEPLQRVINLTRKSGGGCLAHEWFHALDNRQNLTEGRLNYASQDRTTKIGGAIREIIAGTEIRKRSLMLDATRSGRELYWATPEEIGARCFEAWIKAGLEAMGRENDFLVSFMTQDEYDDADGRIEGEPSRYPYPTNEEMKLVHKVFCELSNSYFPLPANGEENISDTSPEM